MLTRIADLWCKTMHKEAMWPIHGRYICPECLRSYSVQWEDPQVEPTPAQAETSSVRVGRTAAAVQ